VCNVEANPSWGAVGSGHPGDDDDDDENVRSSGDGPKKKARGLPLSSLFLEERPRSLLNIFTIHGLLQDPQRPHLRGVPHSSPRAGRPCWYGRYGMSSAGILPMRLARNMP
jgi:hypothetical protein